MSTPPFDPQPCCVTGSGPLEVFVTNQLTEPVDVNLTGPATLDVNVVNQLTEPLDVNVVSTVAGGGGSTTATTTLSAVTTGNGTTVDFTAARSNVSLFVMPNGTVTSGLVALQASQDGTNWVTVGTTAQLATGVNQAVSLNGGAFRWFRGVVSEAVAGGGTVTATLMFG